MEIYKKIKILCAYYDISVSELARMYGSNNPQAFIQKLKRGKLSVEELKEIANVIGCEYNNYFVLPDGTKINLLSD